MISNCFYYGVYSPKGYCSLSARPTFETGRNIALKSYSHTLKQVLFEKIKLELNNRGESYIEFCTADGCEGVYSKDADIRVLDATYCEIDDEMFTTVSLDSNSSILTPTDEILLKRNNAALRARRFLSACRLISNDMTRLDSENIDLAKINRFSSRLWSSTGGVLTGSVGTEHKRFVTCFTPDGVELNMDAFDIYCDRVTVICDKTGAVSRRITDRVRRYALSAGYDVISCICPMNIDLGAEHLIIPELKYGIFTCKHYHKPDFANSRKISAGRFLTEESFKTKNRVDFSFKAYRHLMQEVFVSLKEIKHCDEELDEIYFNETLLNNVLPLIFYA